MNKGGTAKKLVFEIVRTYSFGLYNLQKDSSLRTSSTYVYDRKEVFSLCVFY